MKNISFKNYDATIKDLDVATGIVTGYFSQFNSIDLDGDVIMPGAFTKTIAERGPDSSKPEIAYLWQHDTTKPLGKLLVLREDNFGLYFEAKMSDTTWGEDALKLYRDGVITQHSIGYQVIKSVETTIDMEEEVDQIYEVKLWEGSAVTFGANPNTPFTGFKSAEEREDRIKTLVKAIKNGSYTDETFGLIEFELLKLVSLAKTEEPVKTTTTVQEPKEDNKIQEIKQFRNLLNL
jgi:HK97 family phage prohead protease